MTPLCTFSTRDRPVINFQLSNSTDLCLVLTYSGDHYQWVESIHDSVIRKV